jgi:hypothetical protein
MSNLTLFSTEYITVEYHPATKLIYHTIHQPIGSQTEMFKDALKAGTAALEKYQVCKWLSDDRKNGPLPDELIEWAATNWNVPTVEAGWKYWANVVPKEIEAAGTLIPVIQNLSQLGLRMAVFTSIEDALKWLETMQ